MPTINSYNNAGLNQQLNPVLQKPGEFIQLINVDSQPFGAKTKRAGYTTYLNDLNSRIDTLFTWRKENGTQFWNYAVAGGSVFYSTQGTGDWAICGNGTVTDGTITHDSVIDTLFITAPTGTTRHTTSGTDFTDTSGAPTNGVGVVEYQSRIWIPKGNSIFYSNFGTPTNWTNDSDSILVGGVGEMLSAFKQADRLVMTTNQGNVFKWDGYNVLDVATDLGPSSARSIARQEDFTFYINRMGHYGFGGGKPELISNPIQPQIYNNQGSAIVGTVFDNAPGGQFKHNVYTAVGDVTDSLTKEKITNAIQVYDFQQDEWSNYAFNKLPTAFATYTDVPGVEQFIFGEEGGQCYTYGSTNLDDDGVAVTATMQFIYHGDSPYTDKKWNTIWLFFNPGCVAQVAVAIENTFHPDTKKWIPLGDITDGVLEFHFPPGSRSKLLFIKITESSSDERFTYYGMSCTYDNEGLER